jgi:hypothetical protein
MAEDFTSWASFEDGKRWWHVRMEMEVACEAARHRGMRRIVGDVSAIVV